ncbi:MAG TPA: hypothetical protein VG734_19755 [Lacunisphaera sp.]|nr:hypothetical protein [Lacunisphaera sp.]
MAGRKPKLPVVALPVWRELLNAATAFRQAKPWEFLNDSDVFALVDEDGRPWFPSVLGAAGQVFGLALYRGEAGLRFLKETSLTLEESPHDALYLQDALLMDWGPKQALSPEELSLLSALGHRPKPRERNAWPCYRSHSPGWVPWHLDESEAKSLAAGLQATLACAQLARRQPDFFAPCIGNEHLLPTVEIAATRSGRLVSDKIEWRQWLVPPLPVPPPVAFPESWAKLARRSGSPSLVLEFDIFHALMPTLDADRPFFPRLAMLVDGRTGYIYGMDLATPNQSWAEMVTTSWHKVLSALRVRPKAIAIRRAEWRDALLPLAEGLGIELILVAELPAIDEARDAMVSQLGG